MKKGLVISILAILMLTLFSANVTQAVDPDVSIQPRLIQDDQMKPGDPPLESHPTAHQYTAPVTNPGNSYDNDQITYSLIDITQQPYPSWYSRPTANTGNASVTNPTYARDMIPSTFAAIDITANTPAMREFSVQTFNTTAITSVSSVDLRINYALTIDSVGSNCSYRIVLYVGTKSLVLQTGAWTNTSTTDPTLGVWIAITEPNDGVWSGTEVGSLRVSFETKRSKTQDDGTFKVYEVWASVYRPTVRYFALRTFSPTAISSYSYLNVEMNYTAIIGRSSYRILISVGSANTTVQNWIDVSQINPTVVTWERIAEPNDGWWNQTDLSNMKIIIETQKIESEFNNGEIYIYEAWVTIDPPTVNSYPSAHSGAATVTNPTRAYDKNQMTYASISPPGTTATYFAVQSFNATTLKEYATIDIQVKYSVTAWSARYRIYIQVGTKSLDLLPLTSANQTEPILRTWNGVCEPNDAVWTPTDLSNLQVRVEVKKTVTAGTCTFREYETWLTIPEDSFTVRVNVSGVLISAPLYAWQFNFTFNPTILQAVIVSEGPFLKQAGVTNFAGYTISNTAGWVFAGCAVDDWFGGGIYGSGTLATITFQAIAKGNSMFNFTDTQLRSFDEVNEVPIPLAHTRSPGWFQYLAGDVNGDAKVNVTDLHLLGRAYGTTSGNPKYNVNADQDKDGDVDRDDLITVRSHYGAT